MSLPSEKPARRTVWSVPHRVVTARPRLFISMAAGIVIGFLLPDAWRVTTRLLLGWNVGTFVYMVLVGHMMLNASHESIAQRAEQQDEGRFVILFFSVLAAAAAFGAIWCPRCAILTAGLPRTLRQSFPP